MTVRTGLNIRGFSTLLQYRILPGLLQHGIKVKSAITLRRRIAVDGKFTSLGSYTDLDRNTDRYRQVSYCFPACGGPRWSVQAGPFPLRGWSASCA